MEHREVTAHAGPKSSGFKYRAVSLPGGGQTELHAAPKCHGVRVTQGSSSRQLSLATRSVRTSPRGPEQKTK